MILKFKELARHILSFGTGEVLTVAVGIILIPIYTRVLAPEEYGILSLLLITLTFLNTISTLGINSAFVRSYYDYMEEKDRKRLVGTSLIVILAGTLAFGSSFVAFSSSMSQVISSNADYILHLTLLALINIFQSIISFFLSVMRAKKESVRYSIFNIIWFCTTITMIIIFVAVLQKGVLGVVCGMAISGAINCLILSFASRHDIAFSLLPLEIKKLLRYGLPLIFTNIAGILMNLSDRFFIKYYTGLGEVGIYNLGYQIGSVILVVLVSPFKLIWPATLLSVRHDKDAGEFYSRVMTYFVYAGLFLSLAVGVFATKIVELVGTREYLEAYRVIFIISLSYLLIGMSDVMHVGISIKRKTEYSMLIVSSAALVNLILNFLLVPPWGMMGAAMATILATIFMVYIKQIVVKKIYYIKYEWNRIFTMAAVAVGLYWTISMLGTEDIWYEIPLKLVFVTLFPVILYLSGFYQKIEVETLRSFVKKLFL